MGRKYRSACITIRVPEDFANAIRNAAFEEHMVSIPDYLRGKKLIIKGNEMVIAEWK